MRSLRNIQLGQFETMFTSKPRSSRRQSLYNFLLLLGAGLLLYWWSGGFPPASWRTIGFIAKHLHSILLVKSSLITVSLLLLVFQALAVACAWGMFFWVAMQECIHFLAESGKKPLTRSGKLAPPTLNKKAAKKGSPFSLKELVAMRDHLKKKHGGSASDHTSEQEPLPGPDDITYPSLLVPTREKRQSNAEPFTEIDEDAPPHAALSLEQLELQKNPFEEEPVHANPFDVQPDTLNLFQPDNSDKNAPVTNPHTTEEEEFDPFVFNDPFAVNSPDVVPLHAEDQQATKKVRRGKVASDPQGNAITPESVDQVQEGVVAPDAE